MDARQQTRDASYAAALDFLFSRINYERAPSPPRGLGLNLDRMRDLLRRIGNPEDGFRAIHIAGTKGKGSIAAMISAVLSDAGYRTGLYTSPHLERLEERICLDGQECSPQGLVELVQAVRPAVTAMDREAERTGASCCLTFFEITTAMAFLQFARRNIDAAVIEVGLGGRLDSTNVCRPEISVVATISYDHVRQLGNTLSSIAREKAGIIKRGTPIVSGVTEAEPRAEIERVAQELGAPSLFLNEHFSFEYQVPEAVDMVECAGGTIDFRGEFDGHSWCLPAMRLGMLGSHQAANAAVAVATLQVLNLNGWQIPEVAIRQGLARGSCRARIEVVALQPTIVLDTAHNVASIKALVAVLDESFATQRRILVFAATRDKDVLGMLEHLLPGFESIILTRYVNNPRAVAPTELRTMIEPMLSNMQHAPSITVCDTPDTAWQRCQSTVTPEHLVCVTGSFFLAAEMRSLIAAARAVSLN